MIVLTNMLGTKSTNYTLYPEKRGWGYRITAGMISLLSLAVIGVAVYVKPNPVGTGTHQQLHLPACGFYERTEYPCPTCGMTTAFALMVRGRWLTAFQVQPAGALAALICCIIPVLAGYAAVTGKRFDRWLFIRNGYTMVLIAVAIVLLSWLWRCALVWLEHR